MVHVQFLLNWNQHNPKHDCNYIQMKIPCTGLAYSFSGVHNNIGITVLMQGWEGLYQFNLVRDKPLDTFNTLQKFLLKKGF